jgi:DNA-binding CsgD family transcriptional regulator
MSAWYLPKQYDTLEEDRPGHTIFFHPDFPGEKFWAAYRLAAANGDAIADYARLTSAPFTITEAMHALQLPEGQRWGVDLGRQFGIRDGLCCPLRRWVVVYYAGDILKFERADRHLLAMAAGVAVERIEQLVKKRQAPPIPVLTEREIAVLRLRAKGFNVPEIAPRLGISVTTVRTHVKKMVAKLEAKDLTHALAQAFRAGILI